MVEEVPEEENYPELPQNPSPQELPQKAWNRIFKRGAGWSPGLGSLPGRDGGSGGNTVTAVDMFRLWELGRKRGEGAGAEARAGTGDISGARSVGSLGKEGSKGRTMAYGEVEGRVRRGKRRQTGGSWSPSRRSGEEKEGREEDREEWVEEEGMEEGREEGDADSWPPYVEYPTDWNRTKYFKI